MVKRLLIAGIPLYLALFMIAGVYTRNWPFLPSIVEETAEGIWQSLFVISILTRGPIDDLGQTIGLLSCTKEWCIPTAAGLLIFSLVLGSLMYVVLAKFMPARKKAAP